MKPTFIVTGANGFLGSNIIDQLLALGYNVNGLIQADNTWPQSNKNPRLHFFVVDITKPDELEDFFLNMQIATMS